MANDFYSPTGAPVSNSALASATIRNELVLIKEGFDKLPALTGNANLPVFVNSGETAQEAVSASSARSKLGLVIGTNVQGVLAEGTFVDGDKTKLDTLPTWPAGVSATEVGYLDGVTSSIQTQINGISILTGAVVSSDITVTVGSGGDYATINEALAVLSTKSPQYAAAGVRATISLLAGFVMAEQVIVDAVNLGWITITGVDASTAITVASLTQQHPTGFYPLFGAKNGGVLPVINQLFTSASIPALNVCGIIITTGGTAVVSTGKGVTGLRYGVYLTAGGTLIAPYSNFSGSNTGIYTTGAASIANVSGANLSNCVAYGVYAVQGSRVSANSSTITGSAIVGVASSASFVNAAYADATGATTGFSVSLGGQIVATAATGSLSETKNTLVANGIIFQP